MQWKREEKFADFFARCSPFTGQPAIRTLGKRSGNLNALSPIEKHNLILSKKRPLCALAVACHALESTPENTGCS
jgi:hypothetical protein